MYIVDFHNFWKVFNIFNSCKAIDLTFLDVLKDSHIIHNHFLRKNSTRIWAAGQIASDSDIENKKEIFVEFTHIRWSDVCSSI